MNTICHYCWRMRPVQATRKIAFSGKGDVVYVCRSQADCKTIQEKVNPNLHGPHE